MKTLSLILIVACASLQVNAKTYSKCEFARTMQSAGFPRHELPDWVCLVQHESNFDTKAMNYDNSDGSWDWGIFQINDNWWCKASHIKGDSNGCNINCEELTTDNISTAIKCVKKICQETVGNKFEAWMAWQKYCRNIAGNRQYSVDECFGSEL